MDNESWADRVRREEDERRRREHEEWWRREYLPGGKIDTSASLPPTSPSPPRSTGGGDVDVSAGIAGIGKLLWWWVAYTISLWPWWLPVGVVGFALTFPVAALGLDVATEVPPEPVLQSAFTYGLSLAIAGCGVGLIYRVLRGTYRAIRSRLDR